MSFGVYISFNDDDSNIKAMKALNLNYVKEYIRSFGYECLSDFYYPSIKITIKCNRGHVYDVFWNCFQQGQRCPFCSKNKKLDILTIRKIIRKEGYDIISNSYKNAHKKLWFKCDKGHFFEKSWTNFKEGQRCPICIGIKRFNKYEILKYFHDNDYKVVKYIDRRKIKVKCGNGHEYYTSFYNFKSGYRCRKCFHNRLKNERFLHNNPAWKGGISFEPYCDQWSDKEYKESIKERDGYQCLNPECLRNNNRLSIHHIDYNKKNCHPKNLITLCISCNAKANKDRRWHKSWYQAILFRRYCYDYET